MKSSEAKGTVLRFEKSSIHDGSGLRTVLFLKGCPLRCLWCSTPESQAHRPERGFSKEKCTLCGKCAEVCPNGALEIKEGALIFDKERCRACFRCAAICPASAVVPYGKEMSAEEVVREIAKDEVFYFHSGGGVTISGGEPLYQSEFVESVLRSCSGLGIECAIETSLFSPWEKVEPILPYISTLMTDIKHIDGDKHKEITGITNETILDNIKRADRSEHHFGIVIRTPLVPGVNDGEEAIRGLASFVKGLRKLRFMEFLAYHRLGTETYKRLDMDYKLKDIETPDLEFMKSRAAIFKETAPEVKVKINGVEYKP